MHTLYPPKGLPIDPETSSSSTKLSCLRRKSSTLIPLSSPTAGQDGQKGQAMRADRPHGYYAGGDKGFIMHGICLSAAVESKDGVAAPTAGRLGRPWVREGQRRTERCIATLLPTLGHPWTPLNCAASPAREHQEARTR